MVIELHDGMTRILDKNPAHEIVNKHPSSHDKTPRQLASPIIISINVFFYNTVARVCQGHPGSSLYVFISCVVMIITHLSSSSLSISLRLVNTKHSCLSWQLLSLTEK